MTTVILNVIIEYTNESGRCWIFYSKVEADVSFIYTSFSYHIVISRPPQKDFSLAEVQWTTTWKLSNSFFFSLVQIYEILPAIDFEIKIVINTVIIAEVTPASTVEVGHFLPKESLKADAKLHLLVLPAGRGYWKTHCSGFREERL